ncbi:hypothetical protein F2Q68_00036650 [Brassica cretica]|uniref:Long-chain-fatty-acid--CoA ligase n=1 Tax=Brassica cretica TaxID=69181 RepID=A0A8S9GW71_BRACR|nr:hypothetical protein F2Q68_00036650 [Brassica cretica]
MEFSSPAQRRLQTLRSHLDSSQADDQPSLFLNATASEAPFSNEDSYSVVLPEKLDTGIWNVHRSAKSPTKLFSRFPDHPEIGTLHDNFVHAVETYPDNKYLGTRARPDGTIGEYTWMTYAETASARQAIGSGLLYNGINHGACVGLYFINRPEWLVVDHACAAYSFISVPLYDTLGPDAVKFIVDHATLQAIFCVPQTLNTLLSFLSEIPTIRLVVVVGGADENLPSLPPGSGVKIVSYQKLLSQGRSSVHPFSPPKPEDIATICYTSGTTGTPKGAMLSHENLISNVAGSSLSINFLPDDIYISYLPLAHIYERSNQIMGVYGGVSIGFYQGDIMKLMDDLAVLRPTVFCSVPRLYNRVYDGITSAVKSSGVTKRRLFQLAYNSKKKAILNGRSPSPLWDKLVFNKIKEKLGGRVRFMGSGASPLSPDVMDFLRVCFGCSVREGYGMTETSCVISSMDEGDNLSGHVGSPNPACEVKLVDVPEMNYTSEDQPYPRGEICVRGPIIFKGYYKDEEQTKEIMDEDGWLHTGDIGLWLPGGRLKIVDSFNSSLVAIVAVDPDVMKDWAASEDIKYENLGQLCKDPKVRKAVLAEMDIVGREAQLRGFEFARAVTLVPEPFTLENGLLTPTFKVKRPQAKAYFAEAISKMYAEIAAWDPMPSKL